MGFYERHGGTVIPTRRQRFPTTCGWTAMVIIADHYGTDPRPMGPEQDWPEASMWDIKMMLRIPVKPITHSGRNRSPVPVETDHPFRPKPITQSKRGDAGPES